MQIEVSAVLYLECGLRGLMITLDEDVRIVQTIIEYDQDSWMDISTYPIVRL